MTVYIPALTVSCWHAGLLVLRGGFLYTRTHPWARYSWKRDSSDQAKCFQSSIVQWWCWRPPRPSEAHRFVTCSHQKYSSGSSAPKAHIKEGLLHSSHVDTCWCPNSEICSDLRKSAACLSHETILISRWWSRFFSLFPLAPLLGIWCQSFPDSLN